MLIYTMENKSKAKHNDNYTNDIKIEKILNIMLVMLRTIK